MFRGTRNVAEMSLRETIFSFRFRAAVCLPSHIWKKGRCMSIDVIVYGRSNFGRLLVFVDRRPLSVQLCYIAKLMSVLFTRLDDNWNCGFWTSFVSNFIWSENRMCFEENIRKEKYLFVNYVKILFWRSLRQAFLKMKINRFERAYRSAFTKSIKVYIAAWLFKVNVPINGYDELLDKMTTNLDINNIIYYRIYII